MTRIGLRRLLTLAVIAVVATTMLPPLFGSRATVSSMDPNVTAVRYPLDAGCWPSSDGGCYLRGESNPNGGMIKIWMEDGYGQVIPGTYHMVNHDTGVAGGWQSGKKAVGCYNRRQRNYCKGEGGYIKVQQDDVTITVPCP